MYLMRFPRGEDVTHIGIPPEDLPSNEGEFLSGGGGSSTCSPHGNHRLYLQSHLQFRSSMGLPTAQTRRGSGGRELGRTTG